jgi:hypothetical protein
MQRASRLSTGGAIEAGPGIAVADHLDHLRSASLRLNAVYKTLFRSDIRENAYGQPSHER